jgi:hypothetical protein
MRYVRSFCRFLYDFLVGDAWELFVGPLVGLFLAWLLIRAGVEPGLVGGILVGAVLVVVAVNLTVSLRSSA